MNLKNLLFLSLSILTLVTSCTDKSSVLLDVPQQSDSNNSVLMSSQWENRNEGNVSALSTKQPEKSTNSGGQTIGNLIRFAQFAPNLYRGSQPDENDFMTLRDKYKVKTIVSFRGDAPVEYSEDAQVKEEKRIVEKLGMKFVNYPVPTAGEITNTMLSSYFKTLENKTNLPLYIHCFHGRDRTGTMAEMYKIRNFGISGKEAVDNMLKFGFVTKDYPIFTKQLLSATPSSLKKL